MKKWIAIFLCACMCCALSVTALAVQDDTDYWKERYGIPEPRREDYEDSGVYTAAWNAWYEGFSAFFARETQAEFARQAEEEAARQAEEQAAAAETTPVKPAESEGVKNGDGNQTVEDDADDKFPLGTYVDPDGVFWAPDGTRISSDPASGAAPAVDPTEDGPFSSEEPADQSSLSAAADPDTLAVIAGLVSDIATDPPVFTVEDLRSADPPVEVLTGLKALVTSIFGEYAPVTTTAVVSQTVGNDTHQYLVETVAPGAAGVDYEWIAGVFLFGIMLFCFMKLLGGVLK